MRHLYHISSLKSQGISQSHEWVISITPLPLRVKEYHRRGGKKKPVVREYQNTTVSPGHDKTNILRDTQQLWLPVVVV